MDYFVEIIKTFFAIIGFIILLGIAVVFWELCKNWADNKTKKICDICFRDIQRWNEEIKKRENK